MKRFLLPLALVLLFLTLSCSGGGSSSGGGDDSQFRSNLRDVSFKIEPSGVTCFNQNDSRTFDINAGSITVNQKSCIWYCANYNGETRKYVGLTWQSKNGGPWEKATEVKMDGLCN
jgi:hypothetical protein